MSLNNKFSTKDLNKYFNKKRKKDRIFINFYLNFAVNNFLISKETFNYYYTKRNKTRHNVKYSIDIHNLSNFLNLFKN